MIVQKMDWLRFLDEEAAFCLLLAWCMLRIAMDIMSGVLSMTNPCMIDLTLLYEVLMLQTVTKLGVG